MPSLTEPRRCARGPRCKGYDPTKNLPAQLPRYTEGDFCGQCREEHRGWYRTSNNDRWMDKVTETIEMVFTQRPTPQRPHKATLRDLFDLDSDNGGWKKYSDRGAALMRLDAKTLCKLGDFLEGRAQEAIDDYGHSQYTSLHSDVRFNATWKALPPDKPLLPERQSTPLPLDAMAHYVNSGRPVNLMIPVLAAALKEALDQQQGYLSYRTKAKIIEEKLDVPRTTLQDWFRRMEEVGMTWRKFTADQLSYAALGKKRGAPPKEDQLQTGREILCGRS